jgi:threonine/homoserine/homoserine lactone efflux protein
MLILFLFTVIAISLSGVMMPGPVFAVTITKSYRSRAAGSLIAVGHGIIEFPLMVLIYLGLSNFFKLGPVQIFIGIAGGLMLIYLGIDMIRFRVDIEQESEDPSYNSIVGGLITTTANPYFFLWWATIGSALILKSTMFGAIGFILLALVHWFCDLGWYSLVSMVIHKTHHLWSTKVHRTIFTICGLTLLGFGLWFIRSAIVR